MVSGKRAEAKFCVSTDKGRKQAERWGQHVTPGPQAWAAARCNGKDNGSLCLACKFSGKERIPGPDFLVCTMLAA